MVNKKMRRPGRQVNLPHLPGTLSGQTSMKVRKQNGPQSRLREGEETKRDVLIGGQRLMMKEKKVSASLMGRLRRPFMPRPVEGGCLKLSANSSSPQGANRGGFEPAKKRGGNRASAKQRSGPAMRCGGRSASRTCLDCLPPRGKDFKAQSPSLRIFLKPPMFGGILSQGKLPLPKGESGKPEASQVSRTPYWLLLVFVPTAALKLLFPDLRLPALRPFSISRLPFIPSGERPRQARGCLPCQRPPS